MEQKELTYLLQHPAKITFAQTTALNEVLEQFPYFQAARAVRLKGLKNETSLHYNKELKITAAYTLDRSVLFDFITSEKFNQDVIAEEIKKQDHYQQKDSVFISEENQEENNKKLNQALKLKIRETEEKSVYRISSEENKENPLQLGAPLLFQKNENHSFSEWLKLTKAKPIQREKQNPEATGPKSRKFELIDAFISKSPKIKPAKTGKKTNLAEESSAAPEALMTETLARVYLEQKNYKKAIQAYKILILKNPEKSGFFADQIRAVEKIQEHNS